MKEQNKNKEDKLLKNDACCENFTKDSVLHSI